MATEGHPYNDFKFQLPGAVIAFHCGHRRLALARAGSGESSACLWIVSQFLPLGAPGDDGSFQVRARLFRHFAGDTRFVSSNEVIALGDTDLIPSWY